MRRTLSGIFLIGLITAELGAQSVAVTASMESSVPIGQGVTLPHGTRDCVVVLPLHVIAAQSPPVKVMGDDGVSAEAGVPHFISLTDADIAILSLPSNHPFPCARWNTQAAAGAIDGQDKRPLLRWQQGMSSAFLPVDIVSRGTRELAIVPSTSREQLRETLSGAQLIIGDVTAGILLEIDSVGRGRVIRTDWLERLLPPLMPRPSAESWTVGDRDASLGLMGDGHLLNTVWGGGLELGVPFTRRLDLLVHGGYVYRYNVIVDDLLGTGHVTTVEVGPRIWATPRGRVVALYGKAAGFVSIYRASSDNGKERSSSMGVMAGAGVSVRVLPRIFLSGEYQERRYWPLASTEEPEFGEDEERGSIRLPALRFGITKFW